MMAPGENRLSATMSRQMPVLAQGRMTDSECHPSSFTLTVGGSASLTALFGGQVGGGEYFSSNGKGQGVFTSAGFGGGFNLGANAFIGFVRGGPSTLQGRTDSINISAGLVAISVSFTPNSAFNASTLLGASIGPGAGLGLSFAQENTVLIPFDSKSGATSLGCQ
jgi:hypothetical protein